MKKSPLIGLLALAACGGPEQPQAPPPTPVTVAQPIAREIVDWDDYTGRFEAPQDVEVRARATGVITHVYFRNGQDVQAGQALFEIDPRPYRAAVASAEAQVRRAQAAVTNARQVYARTQTLLASQAVSKEEAENNQATVRAAEADLAAARAQADAARLDLGFTTARAPFAGRASDRRVDLGDAVTKDTTVLTRVVSMNPIWFTFEGAESFYLKALRQDRAGTRGSSRYTANPVQIQLADESGYRWQGRMQFLDNAIDPNSGTIRAKAVVPNPDGFLTPGMFGRARLLGSGRYKAMMIPDAAIVADQTRKLVWVVGKDDKVTQRPVETGAVLDGLRVVRAGLAPTDRVVIDGLGRLQPGMAVSPKPGKIALAPGGDAPPTEPVTTPPSAQATPVGGR